MVIYPELLKLIISLKAIVYSGFAIWSLACGLISTMTRHTHQSVMIVFMFLSSIGSGQVRQVTFPAFPHSNQFFWPVDTSNDDCSCTG